MVVSLGAEFWSVCEVQVKKWTRRRDLDHIRFRMYIFAGMLRSDVFVYRITLNIRNDVFLFAKWCKANQVVSSIW